MCQPELKYLYAFNIHKINISIKSNIKLDDFVDLELSSHNLIDDEKHRILVIQLNDNQELINYANYYLKKNFLIEDEFNVPIERIRKHLDNWQIEIFKTKDGNLIKLVSQYADIILFNKEKIYPMVNTYIELSTIKYICNEIEGIDFHASSIKKDDKVIVFLGESGSGKSTLATIAYYFGAQLIENEHTLFGKFPDFKIGGMSSTIKLKQNQGIDICSHLDIKFDELKTIGINNFIDISQLFFVFPELKNDGTLNFIEIDQEMEKIKYLMNYIVKPIGVQQTNKDVFNQIRALAKNSRAFKATHLRGNITSSVEIIKNLIN